MPIPIFHYLSTLQNGPVGLTEQIWYQPLLAVGIDQDKSSETSFHFTAIKTCWNRISGVLMNPNLYCCGIGTDSFQKRKWEGSHQPQDDKRRNIFFSVESWWGHWNNALSQERKNRRAGGNEGKRKGDVSGVSPSDSKHLPFFLNWEQVMIFCTGKLIFFLPHKYIVWFPA